MTVKKVYRHLLSNGHTLIEIDEMDIWRYIYIYAPPKSASKKTYDWLLL
ncbi:hypothetical protein [Jeotgalibacillus aurantiacus]|nr:hypothetical protein [Jeotgalibacillus aurantiacus]